MMCRLEGGGGEGVRGAEVSPSSVYARVSGEGEGEGRGGCVSRGKKGNTTT